MADVAPIDADERQERSRNATFVFADLAGYTALTEAHGDDFSADLAVAFCSELNRLLPEGAEDLKSLGDACMVRVPRADDAVRFGLALAKEAGRDRPFPHVHIGMHTGTPVRRGGDWYGATINIAARVAAQARPGQVLLTAATRFAAAPTPTPLEDLGARALRHVRLPVRLFSASPGHEADADTRWPVDPVCRLRVPDHPRALWRELKGRRFTFCSARCAAAFDADPVALSVEMSGEARG